ncbi:phospholipase D1-like isoform X2 [Gigantopelta aegis]|uniref:phospholipase D1-like isoform X2 n=1 Tax=Gigantopelta aegis TaxID=1735272 RepID=UPI001B8894B3|nr:phospholipase D1-like isoform X2 [Gigantopelta aegis]
MDHKDHNRDELGTADTTDHFLKIFSDIEWESFESEEDYDFDEIHELSSIPETPADHLDGGAQPHPPTTPGNPKSFQTIFEKPVQFEDLRDNCWIPEEPIVVQIINHEQQGTKVNPYLYTISVKHGDFRWTVQRRYKHFRQLHDALVLFRTRYRIPFPWKGYQERRQRIWRDCQDWEDRVNKERNNARFPLRPEALVGEQNILQRQNRLELYLQYVVRYKSFRSHLATLRFFEVCHLSFVHNLGKKGKEGFVKKCSGGRRINIGCCGCMSLSNLGGTWNRRWLLVKDTFLAYIRPEDGIVSDVMLMDSNFHVDFGIAATGVIHGVLISNLSRKLLIKCLTSRTAREWAQCLIDRSKTTAKDFTQKNRFLSYAPERENSHARWFVDGSSYFEAVADALENAKEEIYISDWWLSPEIYLKRPMTEGDRWRLDLILQRKADAGVKIFILLYKEFPLALGLNSIYSKQTLVSKHPENIKVLRHPDHATSGVLLWTHHEKVVVIDQKVAFLGGFDLCYGRWDNDQHRLVDLGSIVLKSLTSQPKSTGIMMQTHNTESTYITELTGDLHSSVRPPTPLETSSDNQLTLGSYEVHVHDSNIDRVSEITTPSSSSTNSGVKSKERQSVQGSSVGVNSGVKSEERQSVQGSSGSTNSGVKSEERQSVQGSSGSTNSGVKTEERRSVQGSSVGGNSGVKSEERQSVQGSSVSGNSGVKTEERQSVQGSSVSGNSGVKTEERQSVQGSSVGGNSGVKSEERQSVQGSSGSTNSGVKSEERQSVQGSSVSGDSDVKSEERQSVQVSSVGGNSGVKSEERQSIQGSSVGGNSGVKSEEGQSVQKSSVGGHLGVKSEERQSVQGSSGVKSEDKRSVQEVEHAEDSTAGQQFGASSDFVQKSGSKYTGSSVKIVVDSVDHASYDTPSSEHTQLGNGGSNKKDLKRITYGKDNNHKYEHEEHREAANRVRRGMRMVLVVKTFESVVREPQTPENISKQLMFGAQRPTHKLGILAGRWQRHRKKASSLKGLMLHRTKSEEDIMKCGLDHSTQLWIGKDYVNFIYKDFVDLHSPFSDFIDRSQYPRMPWHDIGTVVYGKAASDVARHFIARWNFTKLEKCKKNTRYPLLMPKNHVFCTVPQATTNLFKVKAQILRSSGSWSAGIGTTESSIHEAYIHCIERAKHYVYIENQFFITQIGANTSVNNKIGEALFNRILYSHKKGELFRVYVVMPLLPAFEGEFGTATGTALSAVTHWNYASICRGGNSLIERLAQEVPDPMKYVIFCGLRTHSELAGKPVTELIYVHSKMMIVDDDSVIIGSANINDRSLLGKRDSEIAILVEDRPDNKFLVRFNGRVHMAGKFASSLRQTIFREHLGFRDDHVNITDIVCDDFYKDVWIKQATTNTTMFDKVFHCIPCDCVHKYSDLKQYQTENALVDTDMRQARECLSKIVGNIVLLPLHFLKDENLAPKLGAKEAMLPSYIWT